MAKQTIYVDLQFNADTKRAKQQITDLQTQLNQAISQGRVGQLGVTPEIQKATQSAIDLKIALNNAMNTDTGKLNLNKFQSELKRSGKTVEQYAMELQKLGPAGVQAFNQMASAVASADTRLFNLTGGLKKFTDTMFNTMRWSIASTAIQAVTRSITDTISYAKELDTSLNNIRIVTGKSAQQMAEFAKEANKMAKTLATTTTKYSDASLIYYQQGLSSKEVKERTDVTVKLANVVGENAEAVSEWMTAIWNNFDDGSESLEHYADVLAKLGAATASSADEIAGGLEKFAAVADTIGLSYEYAAAALATNTAETRQSEDVVGTALKTILSRMEQLNQGETLDDGTTLGKYSLALQKVGVDIKNTSGELKDMDIILQETGAKWQTLGRDQQIALAQSVAGIRQYTQFMALMDNWDVMEKNIQLTKTANGALQEQQEIYEDSLEAAENRMKASAETVKSTLLSADDLKPLYKIAAGGLDVINELLEAFGGLPTIILAVVAALSKMYQPQLASFMSQMALSAKDLYTTLRHPIKAVKGENTTQAMDFKESVIKANVKAVGGAGDIPGSATLSQSEAEAKTTLLKLSSSLTSNAKQRAEAELQILDATKQTVLEAAKEAEARKKAAGTQQLALENRVEEEYGSATSRRVGTYLATTEKVGQVDAHMGTMNTLISNNQGLNLSTKSKQEFGTGLQGEMSQLTKSLNELDIQAQSVEGFTELEQAIDKMAKEGSGDLQALLEQLEKVQNKINEMTQSKMDLALDNAVMEPDDDDLSRRADGIENNIHTVDKAKLELDETKINKDSLAQTNKTLSDIDTSVLDENGQKTVENWKKQAAQLEKLDKRTTAYKKGVASLNKEIKNSTKVTQTNTKAKQKGNKVEKQTTGILAKNQKAIKKEVAESKKRRKVTKETEEELKNLGDSTREAAAASTDAGKAVDALDEQYGKLNKNLQNGGFKHWSDNLSAGLSAITSYAMGISMLHGAFSNLFEGIAKGNLTFGDFLSSMSSILMSATMIIPSIISLTNMYKKEAQAKLEVVKAEYLEREAQKAGIAVDALEKLASQAKIKQNKGEKASEEELAAAKIMSGLAGVGKQAGQGPKGWITAAISLAMLAPIAISVGASIISGLSAGSQTDAEAAAEEEETLKGQADDAKQRQDDFKSALSEYKDAQANIDALTVGTEEWTEALQNANAEVIDLLSKYSELNAFVSTDEHGRMTISDEGWTYVSNQLAKEAAMAATMAQAATVKTAKLEGQENREKLLDDTPQISQAFLADLEAEFAEKGEQAFLGLEEELENMGVTSDNAAESLKNVIREQKNIALQEEMLMRTRMNNILTSEFGFNSGILTPGVQKFVTEAGKQDLLEEFGETPDSMNISANWWGAALDILTLGARHWDANNENDANTVNRYARDNGWGVYANAKGEEVFKQYAQAMGLDVEEGSFTTYGKHIKYKLKDGDDEELKVSYDTLLEFEKQQFLESRAATYTRLAQTIASEGIRLSKSSNVADQAIGEYLKSGDVQALDLETFRQLKDLAETGDLETALTASAEGVAVLKEIDKNASDVAAEIKLQLANLTESEVVANALQRDREAYNNTLQSGAQGMEIDINILKAYAENLAETKNGLEENKAITAQIAVEHFRMARGLQDLRKTLQDNISTLRSASKNSLEYAESMGAIKTSIDKVFNSNVSFDFIENNLSEIQSMLSGSVTSYNKVRKALVKDWISNLALDKDSIATISGLFDRLMDQANKGLDDIKLDLDDTAAIDKINNLVKRGLIAESELEAAFRNANLEWGQGTTFTYYDLPQGTTSTSVIKGTSPTGENFEYTMSTYNETTTKMPWIGSNPPQFKTGANATAAATSAYAEGGQMAYEDQYGNEVVFDTLEDFQADYKANGLGKVYKIAGTGKQDTNLTLSTKSTYVDSSVLSYNGEANETSAERADRLKELDDELERYHEIEQQIKSLQREMERLDKLKDRAFGANKIQLMNASIKKTEEEIALQKKYAKEIDANYNKERKLIIDKYGAGLDADGNITNYDEMYSKFINKLKSLDPESAAYAEVESRFEAFKRDINQYEETLELKEDKEDEITDLEIKNEDEKLEVIQYALEYTVEVQDDALEHLDYLLGTIEDDAFKAAEAIEYIGQKTAATFEKIAAYNTNIDDILGSKLNKEELAKLKTGDMSVLEGKEFTEDEKNAIRDGMAGLREENQNLLDQRQEVQDKWIESYEAWNEKMDEQASEIEFLGSVIENYQNIIDIVGKDTLGVSDALMKQMRQTQMENANAAVAAAKNKLDANKAVYEDLERAQAEALARGDEASAKELADRMKEVREVIREGEQELSDATGTALEAVVENFSASIEEIADSFSEAVSGIYGTIEEMSAAFERYSEVSERFLSDYQKTYEISKLNRQINKSIDATDNVAAQEELRKLASEINAYKQGDQKMSQYDLEYMQKKYELLVAEQALRDAQNAKSVVRLQRDSEGNFGYTYTADQSQTSEAEQAYEDKLYAMQDYLSQTEKKLTEYYVSTLSDFESAVRELAEKYGEGSEKYNAEVAKLKAEVEEDIGYTIGQLQTLANRGYEINTEFGTRMTDTFRESILGQMYTDYDSFEQLEAGVSEAVQRTVNAVSSEFTAFQTNVDNTLNEAGLSVEGFSDKATEDLEEVRKKTEEAKEEGKKLKKQMEDDMKKNTKAVEDWQKIYSQRITDSIKSNNALLTSLGNVITKLGQMKGAADDAKDAADKAAAAQSKVITTSLSNRVPSSKTGETTLPDPESDPPAPDKLTLQTKAGAYVRLSDNQWYHSSDAIVMAGAKTGSVARLASGAKAQGGMYVLAPDWQKRISNYKREQDKYTLNSKGAHQSSASKYDLTNWFKEQELFTPITGKLYGTTSTGTRYYSIYIGGKHAYVSETALMGLMAVPELGQIPNSFDTGGYTGAWGPEGRMAMLHQKELVLNAADTENFLAAVKIVRSMADMLDANAAVARQGLAGVVAATIKPAGDIIEQNVTIHAEFPNATDHNQIEEAFGNLVNLASQYANRKN